MLKLVARLEDDDVWDAFGNHLCVCQEELSSSVLRHFISACPIPPWKRWARRELLLALEREHDEGRRDRASTLMVIKGVPVGTPHSTPPLGSGPNMGVLSSRVRDNARRSMRH